MIFRRIVYFIIVFSKLTAFHLSLFYERNSKWIPIFGYCDSNSWDVVTSLDNSIQTWEIPESILVHEPALGPPSPSVGILETIYFLNLIIQLTECWLLAPQALRRLRVMGAQTWRVEDSSFPARGFFCLLNSFTSDSLLRLVTAVINLTTFYLIYHCLRSILFSYRWLDFSPLRPYA